MLLCEVRSYKMKEISQETAIEIRKKILEEFHKLCEEKSLNYSLGYGTLLGAVRHSGMIPWDDDIDIVMPRYDYEKLSEIYADKQNKNLYQFVNHQNHPEIKTKIGYFIDYSTITEIAGTLNDYHGIHIDIYPVDILPNGKIKRSWLLLRRSIIHLMIRAKDLHPDLFQGRQRLIRKLVLTLCRPFNYDKLLDKLSFISKKYMEIPEEEKKSACCLVEYGNPQCFPYSAITEYTAYDYEGHKYFGFKDYDALLRAWYGNYMEPPQIDKQHRTEHKHVSYYYKDR